MLDTPILAGQPSVEGATTVRLSEAERGQRGTIIGVSAETSEGIASEELHRRLLEFGFVEGARVELIHEGLVGRNPIAVRLDDMRVALRRGDARGVLIALDSDALPLAAE
nr:FeoA family protein [Caulobacter ginsengisoli]